MKEAENNTYLIESKSNIASQIQKIIIEEKAIVLDLHRKDYSMETIFRELTKK